MPEDGSRLCNVAALADEARQVELAIPLERFERVTPQLAATTGMVNGSVALDREEGRIVAEVTLATQVQLLCQRCLEPMPWPVQSSSRVTLVESEAAAAELPPELETALAPDGRLHLADLVEEELLLALPAAPLHPEGECPAQRDVKQEEFAEPTQRPFAALGELLKSRPKQ
jgi:uncharacterized protein